MHDHATLVLSLLFCGVAAPAQNFWVVDASNGPGAHFTDLPAAVQASAPGDFVLLRYVDPSIATYSATTISHGLTIVGVNGRPGVTGDLTVSQIPAGQQVALSELRLPPFEGSTQAASCRLRVLNNIGSVHLQCMTRDITGMAKSANSQYEIVVQDSGFVTFTDCELPGVGSGTTNGFSVANTDHVLLQGCTVLPDVTSVSSNVMVVSDSTLTLIDSTISRVGFDAPIRACGSTIRLAGVTHVSAGTNGSVLGVSLNSCTAATTVLVAPSATVGAITSATAVPTDLAALAASFDIASNTMTMRVHGDRRASIVLFSGPRATTPIALPFGDLWIDPAAAYIIAVLPPGTVWQGPYSASQPCPITAWLQAVTVGPTGVTLTNPSVLTFP